MASNSLAIELTSGGARGAKIKRRFGKATLAGLFTIDRAEGEDDGEFFSRLRAEFDGGGAAIIVGAKAQRTSTRRLRFPVHDPRKLEATLAFEVESATPFELDEIATTWQVVGRRGRETELLASLHPRHELEQQIAMFESAGLVPRAIVDPAAALCALSNERTSDDDGPHGVLHVGAVACHFAIITGGVASYTRSFVASGPQRCREIVTAMAMTLRSLPEDLLPESIWTSVEVDDDSSFDASELTAKLRQRLGVEVAVLDLEQAVGDTAVGDNVEITSAYLPAIALGLEFSKRGAQIPGNFRRGTLAFQGDLNVFRDQLTHLAAWAAVVLAIALGGGIMELWSLRSSEEQIDRQFCAITKALVGREICDPTAALATMRTTPGNSSQVMIPEHDSAAFFEGFSRIVDKSFDVTFKDLDFRVAATLGEPHRITGTAETATFDTTEKIARRLRGAQCVKTAEVSRQRKDKRSGKVEFNLKVELSCGDGEQFGANAAPATATNTNEVTQQAKKAPTKAAKPQSAAPKSAKDGTNKTLKKSKPVSRPAAVVPKLTPHQALKSRAPALGGKRKVLRNRRFDKLRVTRPVVAPGAKPTKESK